MAASSPSPEPDHLSESRSTGSLSANHTIWLLPLIIVLVDQLTKWLIHTRFDLYESITVVGDFVRLTYIRNPGGAFGLRWGHDAVYFVSAILIIGWIAWQLWRQAHTRHLSVWALASILGGAIGNMIDRIVHGEVIDFIDVEFFDIRVPGFDIGILSHPGYLLDRWPAFNVADSAVSVGIVLLLFSLWRDPALGHQLVPTAHAGADSKAPEPVDPELSSPDSASGNSTLSK